MQEAAVLTLAVSYSLGFPSPRDHRRLLVLVSVFWASSSLMLVGDPELPG